MLYKMIMLMILATIVS